MIFILEGLDAVGKTTVAKKLSLKFDLPLVKGSSFEQAQYGNEQLYQKFYNLSLAYGGVFDRFHLSNLVYADIFKDYAMITPEQQKVIEDNIRNKSKTFYLYADLDVIKERLASRGDEYINESHLEKIAEKYEEVLQSSSLDIIRIDTTNKTESEVYDEVWDGIVEGYF